MDIQTYRSEKGLSQADFAALLLDPPATQGLVSHWETERLTVTAERAVQIEKATKGVIRRGDLRPDLFDAPKRRKAA